MSKQAEVSKPLIHAAQLAPASATIKSAIGGEDKAHDAWKKGAKALYSCGLRYSMIGGADQDKATRAEVSDWITTMLPEKMRRLLTLKGRDVAELGDNDKVARKMYQQRIGVYLSRIAKYLADHEGVQAERKPRAAAAAAAATPTMEHTMWAYLMFAQEMMAHRTKIGMSAKDADELGNALETALVILRRAKAAADKLVK